MAAPSARGGPSTAARLVTVGLLAAAVTAALYAAGRLHTPIYAVSLLGQAGLAEVVPSSVELR